MRILLIEDNSGDATMFCHAAGQCNGSIAASVEVVHTLEAARDRVCSFDVLVSDLSLPDSQPFETIEFLREQRGTLPVLIFSGSLDTELIERTGRLGIGYLAKQHTTPAVLEIELLWQIGAYRARQLRCAMISDSVRILERNT